MLQMVWWWIGWWGENVGWDTKVVMNAVSLKVERCRWWKLGVYRRGEFRKGSARRGQKYWRLRHCSGCIWCVHWSAKAKGLVCESARKFRVFEANAEPVPQGSHWLLGAAWTFANKPTKLGCDNNARPWTCRQCLEDVLVIAEHRSLWI